MLRFNSILIVCPTHKRRLIVFLRRLQTPTGRYHYNWTYFAFGGKFSICEIHLHRHKEVARMLSCTWVQDTCRHSGQHKQIEWEQFEVAGHHAARLGMHHVLGRQGPLDNDLRRTGVPQGAVLRTLAISPHYCNSRPHESHFDYSYEQLRIPGGGSLHTASPP